MALRQVSDGGSEGVKIGQSSTDKIGFYGLTTPIARPSATTMAAFTAGGTTTQANAALIDLYTQLVALGLIA